MRFLGIVHLMIMSVIIKFCYAEKNTRLLKATNVIYVLFCQDRRDRDRMVVGFTTTYAISAYHH